MPLVVNQVQIRSMQHTPQCMELYNVDKIAYEQRKTISGHFPISCEAGSNNVRVSWGGLEVNHKFLHGYVTKVAVAQ